jgi:hypothetical protein
VGGVGKAEGGRKGGKMTQTLYTHMNRRKRKKERKKKEKRKKERNGF